MISMKFSKSAQYNAKSAQYNAESAQYNDKIRKTTEVLWNTLNDKNSLNDKIENSHTERHLLKPM